MERTFQPPVCASPRFELMCPQCMVMPNGIPLYVFDAGENEVVRIDVVVKGGRWQQRLPLQALFTNRLLREGSSRYTSVQIAERLDYYGAWLDLSVGQGHSFVTLYSLNKYLPQTLDLLENLIKEPSFPDNELSTILDNNVQQFKINMQKVDFLAHRELVKALYGCHHPDGRVIEESDYKHISSAILREFHSLYYHSGNCSVYVTGKVTDECVRRLESCLGNAPFGLIVKPVQKTPVFMPVPTADKRIFVTRPDALQSAVRMGLLTVQRTHPDYVGISVLVTLLGGYFGSRLMSNIREKKGYTYNISAGLVSCPGSSAMVISTETDNEYVEPLINEVYHEIDRLLAEPVSQDELNMVKNYMLGDLCRSYESVFSLSDAWIFLHTSCLPDNYFELMQDTIKSITPRELYDLAGKYLCKEILKEVVAGKKMS